MVKWDPVAWFITSSSKEEDLTPVLATLKDKIVAAYLEAVFNHS
jgi:hypothetical protein